jgi:hypothetical protein
VRRRSVTTRDTDGREFGIVAFVHYWRFPDDRTLVFDGADVETEITLMIAI